MYALEINHVSKIYNNKFKALDDVDFQLNPGDFVGLLGINGAGKTSLISSIAGINSFKGQIKILGQDVLSNLVAAKKQLGVVPQELAFDPFLTVRQTLVFQSGLYGLDDLERQMREAENDPHEGKRKAEAVWPIFRIHHQRSRYIYELFHRRKAISRELYEYCLREGIADKNLIAKWKKPGYERLCCLRCIQAKDHAFGTVCVCRVPKDKLEEGKVVECQHCGCRGCASGD